MYDIYLQLRLDVDDGPEFGVVACCGILDRLLVRPISDPLLKPKCKIKENHSFYMDNR